MYIKDVAARRGLIAAAFACLIVSPAQTKELCETDDPKTPVCLEQKWDNTTRDRFWYINQGSLIIPVKWFKALEQVDSPKPFTESLLKYGFITNFINKKLDGVVDQANVKFDRTLPIGFAVTAHWKKGTEYVGLTCAACHTGLIISGDKQFMIDGAPAMVDFDGFLDSLVAAMEDTLKKADKWSRFRTAIQPAGSDVQLKKDFGDRTKELRSRADADRPSAKAGPAGFGRLDAFGHIFNRVVVEHLENPPSSVSAATQKSDAPASFPALWDIAQHSHVQWNFSAPNLGVGQDAIGSLIRNVGEVLGVFGETSISKADPGIRREYDSSADIPSLKTIEGDLANLRSPAWPFSAIDQSKREAGGVVYQREGCQKCHEEIDRLHTSYNVTVVPVAIDKAGTDKLHDSLIQGRLGPVGKVAGAPRGALLFSLPITFAGEPIQFPSMPTANEKIALLTAHLALNVLPNKIGGYAAKLLAFFAGLLNDKVGPKGVYKARPLNGIWATAPYLHNGSVPNLTEMLKPAKDRMKRFCVGDRKYDLENVGFNTYKAAADAGNCLEGTSLVKTGISEPGAARGSGNQGHEFGVSLGAADKANLIEYLKSL